MNSARWALFAAAATGVQVGVSTVASRFAIEETTPVSLAFLRYLIGFVCLAPALFMIAPVPMRRADWAPVCALGLGQFGVLIVLLNWGLKYIPAAEAALIFSTMPLLTWLLLAALGEERLSPARGCAVALSIAGVFVAMADDVFSGAGVPPRTHWWGEAAVAASALVGALCSIFYRPYLRRYPAVQVGSLAMFASLLVLGALSWLGGSFAAMTTISATAWGAISFIGVFSAVGYFLWLWALQHRRTVRRLAARRAGVVRRSRRAGADRGRAGAGQSHLRADHDRGKMGPWR
jgi:drug/metabolite transporter (DMT)-like permease